MHFNYLLHYSWLVAAVTAQSYRERYRPQYHFTPAMNWMNDPNGLIYHQGQYHLFFQYNPGGNVWGNMSWGHAVSTDLTHWTELPIALKFRQDSSGNTTEMFFSGSAVSDAAQTSGFGDNGTVPLVAVYTSYYPQNLTLPNKKTVEAGTQAQSIAYSTDNGLTWEEYEGNPVIPSPPSQYADQYKDFRDPFVFWYEPGKHWVMVVSLAQIHKLVIYHSSNLKDWTEASQFGPVNAIGGAWECPSLYPLPVDGDKNNIKWVLMLGVNPGGPALASGSGTQYIVGSFDGTTFTADADNAYPPQATSPQANWVDYGPDYYAAATYNGLAEYDRVTIGWMNDWAYGTLIPTDPWRSAMSIPRVLSLNAINGKTRLIQQPQSGLNSLERGTPLYQHTWNTSSPGNLSLPITGKALDIELSFSAGTSASQFGINVRAGSGYETAIGYDYANSQMFVNRYASGNSSFSPEFAGVYYAPLSPTQQDGTVSMRVLLDWSSVEVFGGQGESVMTAQIFPADEDVGVSLFSVGTTEKIVIKVYEVSSAWTSKSGYEEKRWYS